MVGKAQPHEGGYEGVTRHRKQMSPPWCLAGCLAPSDVDDKPSVTVLRGDIDNVAPHLAPGFGVFVASVLLLRA